MNNEADMQNKKAFTAKSLLFGLLGILLIAGLSGFHDQRISTWPPMIGMHLPIAAYFYITLIALLWNGITARFVPALTLNTRELIVVMTMTLVACFPPTSGLFRYFHRQLILPWYYLASGGRTEWEELKILSYLPAKIFPQPAPVMEDGILQLDETVYRGFFTGLAEGNRGIGLSELPLAAWLPPLRFWAPLVALMSLAIMSLSLLVHRQWAHHEQLSYPLAQVASSFLKRSSGKGIPDLFRSKLFWWGFLPIFLLYVLEYLHVWYPETVPGLSTVLPNIKGWSVNIESNLPILKRVPTGRYLGWQNTFFSVIGLAYFVSAEISLTMGLSALLLAFAGGWFFISTGVPLSTTDMVFSYAGAYIGYAAILLFTGHAYYLPVFKKALRFRRDGTKNDAETVSVLAARLFLAAFSGFVAVLVIMGLDWLIAICFGLLLMLLFLVFARIICETGIPFMQAGWMPGSLLVSLAGPAAIGPGPLVFILYLGTILCIDPRESLMPFVATSIKMADDANLRIRRIFWVLFGAVIAALAIAFVASSWTNYNYGGMSSDGWSFSNVPTMPFDEAGRHLSLLNDTGDMQAASAADGLAKLGLINPDPNAWSYLAAGLIAVVLFFMLRFRFSGFPLHPVLFLVWGTYPANLCWSSFLIGWGIKSAVVKFGGGKVYQNLKPFFIGLIAAELIAAGSSIFIEMIYYWVTGSLSGVKFGILPG